MPGEDYLAVLSRIHDRLRPASYLEIGVRTGDSLAIVREQTRAVGIDPMLRVTRPIKSRARLYPLPSDEFFARYDLFEELGAPRLALAFIDGLHLFEQVLKDFINVERYADRETVILVHDCLPVSRSVTGRRQAAGMWCGDVWKLVPCLRSHRPELTVRIIPTLPSGLTMITGADSKSRLLAERYDEILTQYRDAMLAYDRLDPEYLRTLFGLLPNDPRRIDESLSHLPVG